MPPVVLDLASTTNSSLLANHPGLCPASGSPMFPSGSTCCNVRAVAANGMRNFISRAMAEQTVPFIKSPKVPRVSNFIGRYHGNATFPPGNYGLMIRGWSKDNDGSEPLHKSWESNRLWQVIKGQCWLITNQIRPCFLVGVGWHWGGALRLPWYDMSRYTHIYIYVVYIYIYVCV